MKARTIVPFRRKREGKTDYKRRIKLLKSQKLRLVIRLTLKNTMAQLIQYHPQGDKVLIGVNTQSLKDYGWQASTSNIPAAYLVGYLVGKKALSQGKKEAVLDKGLSTLIKGSRIYACLKGALDAGLSINHGEGIYPSEERINGQHIAAYAKQLKGDNKEKYEKQFAAYLKNNLDPEKITDNFQETKANIDQGVK